MKQIVGLLLIVSGIAVGLYVGLWWALIGGIVNLIEQIRAEDMSTMVISLNMCKVLFASFLGYMAAGLLIVPGITLLKD